MSRYQQMFENTRNEGRGAIVPFLMIGDPCFEESLQWADHLIAEGADALEIGMPFSDPVADGPVIQAAAIRALNAGITPKRCFEFIQILRNKYPELPLGLLSYANLAVSNGLDCFYQSAQQAGLDSILLADIPSHACQAFLDVADKYQIQQILIAPPNASVERLQQIAQKTKGYTYVVSRSGVTGHQNDAGFPHHIIQTLHEFESPPCLLGFGIGSRQDVQQALAAGCAGAICGSALVKLIEVEDKDKRYYQASMLMTDLCLGLELTSAN